MVLEKTRTSVGRRLRCPRAGGTVGATGIRRPRAGRTTTTASPSLREGAASEITGEGEPWGTSLRGLRRRVAIAGAGVGAQSDNSAPILRLGVGAAGAETVVGETRLRLGVAVAGARTRAGAIAGRPALTAVAVGKGDGGQATVENHLRKEPAGPSTYAFFIQKLAAAWDTQDKSSGIDRLRSFGVSNGETYGEYIRRYKALAMTVMVSHHAFKPSDAQVQIAVRDSMLKQFPVVSGQVYKDEQLSMEAPFGRHASCLDDMWDVWTSVR
ncbi:unnamed protein product [Ectocarpus sp. CCAP 1310/34]|nr:unnamed protein product [Ectocarpus sp. CCAP 1310/34]